MKEAYKSLKPQVLKAANEAAQRLKPIKDSALTVIGGDRERSIDGVVTGEWLGVYIQHPREMLQQERYMAESNLILNCFTRRSGKVL
ncbi:hypothetical protein M3650_17985 [Paenibacillus sp. MER TA 81-3]|uniref:hypothetical protein n=1 Tax=Paenibacillus sp. MER TA 81-3 TaxID=2939573 RepID=UPI00203A9596|nr:hypothetical protein [Paenibacillus sp. MER TA 81-3]MCM3340479.1 hypothetical protein [Paenibacillus sp. MER TA 81-3]